MEDLVIGGWLSEAVLSRRWCDVSILCDGKHFWAHRLVLSTASPFIRGLLLSRPTDDIPTTLVFADFSYQIVEALLQYIYCGEVSVLPEHVEDFLSLSQALKVHVDLSTVSGMSGKSNVLNILKNPKNKEKDLKSNYNSLQIDRYRENENISSSKCDNGSVENDRFLNKVPDINKNENISNNIFSHLIANNNNLTLSYTKPFIDNLMEDNKNLSLDRNILDKSIVHTVKDANKTNALQSMLNCNYFKTKHFPIKDMSIKNCIDHNIEKSIAVKDVNSMKALNGITPNIHNSNRSESIRIEPDFVANPENFTINQHHLYKRDSIHRNETITEHIPSLIPISSLSTNSYFTKTNRKLDALDLSSNRYQNKSHIHPKYQYTDDTLSYANDSDIRRQYSNGDLRIKSCNNTKIPVQCEQINFYGEKRDVRTVKSIPQNKVLDSPWTTKGPIFYCHKIKRARESQQEAPTETANEIHKSPVEHRRSIDESENGEGNASKKIKSDKNNNTNDEDADKTRPDIVDDDDACVSKCPSCSKMFTSKATLAAHVATHASRARYRCDQCDKSFSQLRNYKYHVSVHKGTKEFAATCNVCGKYFNDRGYLSSHMKIHRNRKEYQCPHCPKSFNQRVAYNMHVRIHTGVKPHQCEACGKAFSRKMLLKQHARTHSGEKPYACTSCGKRFADRSNMTLHMRLHSGVKPFSCDLCSKSFTKKHHLKTHLNYHTGDKPYACSKCGLTFSQSSNMRTHMKKCSAASTSESVSSPSSLSPSEAIKTPES